MSFDAERIQVVVAIESKGREVGARDDIIVITKCIESRMSRTRKQHIRSIFFFSFSLAQ